MYFLEKLCRICVQTGASLVDIDTVDFDFVRLSEKLEICTNLAISKDKISSEICEKCVNKLRVSYHFLNMCKKSTNIIQGYLGKLKNAEGNNTNANHHCSDFENSDLSVEIKKLTHLRTENLDFEDLIDQSDVHREYADVNKTSPEYLGPRNSALRKKQRITKEQRCSLLKQLLNRPKKERDKSLYCHNTYDYEKGGLKNIIDFTKNYEFSFNLDKNSNIESTPLDKLTAFSTNYFTRDFSDFKTHILYIIENRHNFECGSTFGSDDEDYLSGCEMDDENNGEELRFEEVMVEPDIKIKNEVSDGEDEDSQCPLDYLETSFEEEDIKVKKEDHSDLENDSTVDRTSPTHLSSSFHTTHIKEELPMSHKNFGLDGLDLSSTIPLDYKSSLCINSSPAVKLLDRLVATYPLGSRKVFSPSNVRCRTRDQPYINPMLKNQFLYRSFKCERCNRYFKSQGYLKAHTSKVH